MTWVITRLCRDCVDLSCIDVCPVECIYEYKGDDKQAFPNQLYINPDECIDCAACEPECPWEAIYEDEQVPQQLRDDTELNAKMMEIADQFEVPERVDKPRPEADEVTQNKKKWGLSG